MKLVCVLVLNWNGWQDTVKCIDSLKSLAYPNYEIVVLDNASTNDSVARIREAHPDILLIETGANLGFAGGNNIGIRYALERGADYIWLLNNDTIVSPDALTAMIEVAESDPKIGAVGSVLYYMNQTEKIQAWGGGRVNLITGRSRHLLAPGDLHYITGASMLLRREALEQVGLLDESFFMYWEDADLSLRLRREGWKLAVAEGARVLHKESASAGKKSLLQDELYSMSLVRFLRQNTTFPFLPLAIGIGMRLLKRAFMGEWDRFGATWTGFIRGLYVK